MIGYQHVNQFPSQCCADRTEFLRAPGNAYHVIDLSDLLECQTNDPVIQIRRNLMTTIVKVPQIDVPDRSEFLQSRQLLPSDNIAFLHQNGFRAGRTDSHES